MAQTLKFGNKTWATKVGSTLAYNDENGNYKPLPFAFTRSTSATRVNKEGLIEVVTNDRPRIDYTDTSDGVLLLEKASTNLLPYSNDFSNSAWDKYSFGTGLIPVVTSNNAISPDGTLNASKVVFNTGSGTTSSDQSIIEESVNTTSGVSINQSVYLKGENGGETILVRGAGGSSYTTLTLTDKWVRYDVTETSASTLSYWAIGLRQGLGGVVINSTVTIYMYGAQFEQNSVASSYIPTQGSASTRVAETASDSGNSEVFNDSEGVLFANIAANANDGTSRQISLSSGSSATNKVSLIYTSTSNQIQAFIRAGGSISFNQTITVSDLTNFNKIILKYKQDNFSLWINGFEVSTDASGNAPTGLNVLDFDDADGTSDFYGKTKEIGYYNTILTDLELETLTSYKSWTSMVNELNLNIIYNG